VGTIHVHVVVDVFRTLALYEVLMAKMPIAVADLLYDRVLCCTGRSASRLSPTTAESSAA
jgi:hypothetical protein